MQPLLGNVMAVHAFEIVVKSTTVSNYSRGDIRVVRETILHGRACGPTKWERRRDSALQITDLVRCKGAVYAAVSYSI